VQNTSYVIKIDKGRQLLRITMSGFFAGADIRQFVEAKNKAIYDLTAGPGHLHTLVDIREMQIQPQDSVAAFQRVLSDPLAISKRIAFVVSASLARLQIRRAAADREAEYFTSIEAAEAWLMSNGCETSAS
jgi:hypothetical protein